ncbi:GNAT family N-acetyltransferase [Streptomyces sp. H39-S7]|uniref:GNAT family N-acetyltransferase n=1 Tax=Streptomyces sp. H39-S7 TaxID=3004357 RepID=UPI0022AE5A73|nr:GNAT family N-acetyltransferase [Streptomyces sp. H39-S7]MCZ4120912.1 GNAT family N-acetyltransferase [Streptomyces sp. H39-S7]
MGYEIRATEPHEWQRRKQLRLAALLDPASSVAFVNTYATEAAFPEETWQRRGTTPGFVAVNEAGEWVGSATVLVEVGAAFPVPQTHIVGVYMAPEGRGTGLSEELLRAAIDWSWELPEKIGRVRLWVHEDNARAQAFYARLGFTRTGETMAFPLDASQTEYELELARPV